VSKFAKIASPFIVRADSKVDGLRGAFDLESDELLDKAKVIHCLVIGNLDTGEIFEYGGPEQIPEALTRLARFDYLVGHNASLYDLPLLQKLYHWMPKSGCVIVDTLVASRLILPHLGRIDDRAAGMGDAKLGKLRGSHSLEAWGARLGISKTGADITDFSKWSPELQARCVGDVTITVALWRFLRPDSYSPQALALEHRAAAVCNRISSAGVLFDTAAAERVGERWSQRCAELALALCAQFPELKKVTRPRIITLLQERGWTPEELTDNGNPALRNNTLENLASAYPEFAGAAEYFALDWLLGNMLRGKSAWARHVRSDGCIRAVLIHLGQPHGRASCVSPNLHGIPNPKKGAKFGTECRTLFHAPDAWVMVAADMANFQDRALAHYLFDHDGGKYVQRYLSGEDMHWSTVSALGLIGADVARDKENSTHTALREGCKRFKYAFLFGAQAKRLGRIVYETVRAVHNANPDLIGRFFGSSTPGETTIRRVGARALEQFMTATPGLGTLRESIAAQVSRGWTLGLDKRRIPLLAQHTSLNYLLVAAEAVVCKHWLIQVHDELAARFGSDAYITLWVHDEIVCASKPAIAKEVGEIMVRHAKAAGEFYDLKVPLDAEYTIGRSWAGEPVDSVQESDAPATPDDRHIESHLDGGDGDRHADRNVEIPDDLSIPSFLMRGATAADFSEQAVENISPGLGRGYRDEINVGLKREGIEPIDWKALHSDTESGTPDPEISADPEPASEDDEKDELRGAQIGNGGARNGSSSNGGNDHKQYTRDPHSERETGQQVAFFIYRHADGQPYLGVKKTSTKQFPQYRWNGQAWVKGAPQGLRIPYRLPELIKAPRDAWIVIAAGEKDAETAAGLGFVATTNPEGERKGAWAPELNAWFAGRKHTAIMEDNDATGRAHVLEVAEALRGIVSDIRIVTFNDLAEHGDLTDWKERGHGHDDLRTPIAFHTCHARETQGYRSAWARNLKCRRRGNGRRNHPWVTRG
jgi:DNA polymerase I-like protein with 3'-5' exonuclease and polymerase domains